MRKLATKIGHSRAPAHTASAGFVALAALFACGVMAGNEPPGPVETPGWEEKLPPVARDEMLSDAQIRYCVAQNIRIEAIRPGLNRFRTEQVAYFNQVVADYNGRCGRYRYEAGALERVKAQVEADRTHIENAARAAYRQRFPPQQEAEASSQPSPAASAASLSAPAPARSQPSPQASVESHPVAPTPAPAQPGTPPPAASQPRVPSPAPARQSVPTPVASQPSPKASAELQPSAAAPTPTAPSAQTAPAVPATQPAAEPPAVVPPAQSRAETPAPPPVSAAAQPQPPPRELTRAAPPAVPAPTPPAKPEPPVVADTPLERFTKEIRRDSSLVVEEPYYPAAAQGKGWEGSAYIDVRFAAEGYLRSMNLAQSSGHDVLDETALRIIRDLTFPDVPEALRGQEFTVRVPVVFRPRKPR